jgi:hypothetical protein
MSHLGRGSGRSRHGQREASGAVALLPFGPDEATKQAAASRRRDAPNSSRMSCTTKLWATASTMESAQRERKGTPRPENPTPRRAEPPEHSGSSSSPPRPAKRCHEPRQSAPPKLLLAATAGQELGGHQHRTTGRERRRLFQETRRPTPPDHLQPEEHGRRRRTALDLRSAADLRSAPGHHGPTYEGRKPKLQGTPAPHLRQSQPANASGRASDRAVADGALEVL